jgi:hypothetical protein
MRDTHSASDFLRAGARFSIPEFSRFLREWTQKQRGQQGLAELGAAWREKTDPARRLVPEEATFHGFAIPAWVRPPSASDAEIGRNILKFSAEIDRRIEAEIQELTPARRQALEARAQSTESAEDPPPGNSETNRKKNQARRIKAQMVFDLRTMHYFRVRDGGKPDIHMGATFEKYLRACCGRVQY